MNDELHRDMVELFDYKETPVVSLPQFVIDRIKPCIEAALDGLTFEGQVLFVNGKDALGHPIKNTDESPVGLPKVTPEFEKWRDDIRFKNMRQMKIMIALIYSFKLEEKN